MSANPLAKWRVPLPRVPDAEMCEDLLEELLLEATHRPDRLIPAAELSVRCWTVITWLNDRRTLSAREQADCLRVPSIPAFIGKTCWEALGEPTSEEWQARLRGRKIQS